MRLLERPGYRRAAGRECATRSRRPVSMRSMRPRSADLVASARAEPRAPRPSRSACIRCGQGDVAIGIAPPFGHSDAETLQVLVDRSPFRPSGWAAHRARSAHCSLWALPRDTSRMTSSPRRMRWASSSMPGDPRRRVIACAGAPICSSGRDSFARVGAGRSLQASDALRPRLRSHLRLRQRLRLSGRRADDDRRAATAPARFTGATTASAPPRPMPCPNSSGGLFGCAHERPQRGYDYIRDGTAIYERSFAIIRAETDLSRFSRGRGRYRRAHGACLRQRRCGANIVQFGHGLVAAARAALRAGAPILCDSEMVAHGVTRARLPAGNEVRCTLARSARRARSRRSSAPRDPPRRWSFGPSGLAGSVVAIGNAPTALFHLLEMLAKGAPKPAAILGVPVGFVGAAESKEALAADPLGRALSHRARPARRQRHDGRRHQRAGEGRAMSGRSDRRRRRAGRSRAA